MLAVYARFVALPTRPTLLGIPCHTLCTTPYPAALPCPTVPGAGPAFTLGGRPQPPQDPASSPGPGEYPLPSSLGGPAFTLGAKIAVKEGGAEGPSPGDYEVHIRCVRGGAKIGWLVHAGPGGSL
jgi:hypothetical protein